MKFTSTLDTTIIQSGYTATINHKGAELISFKSSTREYIWEGNPDFWGKHSPVLFPIVGTLKNNQYTHNGETFSLPRHGFARDYNFNLIHKSENQAVFSLKANDETLQFYPFDFELQIIYTIDENQLTVAYKVINNEGSEIPFSLGAHPAFALPENFENYSLAFEPHENLISYQLENDLLSDKTVAIKLKNNILPLTYSLFENDALIFKKMNSKKISILENNIPLLDFHFEGFPNFGIWTKQNAAFLCLEPWIGYSDTLNSNGNFNEKEGIQFIDSEKIFECHWRIVIL